MKKIIYILLVILLFTFLVSCETEPPKPDTPIFSEVEILVVEENPAGTYLFKNLPSYVTEIHVLIFADGNTPIINDSEKRITNSTSMEGGNRTDLPGGAGISRTAVTTFYPYDSGTGDFDTAGIPLSLNIDDWFIALGYDASYNLTHASPKYREGDLD